MVRLTRRDPPPLRRAPPGSRRPIPRRRAAAIPPAPRSPAPSPPWYIPCCVFDPMLGPLAMNRRGQSTVEPMLAVTGVLFALVLAAYVRHDAFMALVAAIAEWIGARVELP